MKRFLAALSALFLLAFAQPGETGSLTLLGAGKPPTGGAGANTFDPAATSAGLALSGGNLIVTYNSPAGSSAGTKTFSTGVHVFKVSTNATGNVQLGVVGPSWTAGQGLQDNANAGGYYGGDGHIDVNNVTKLAAAVYGSATTWIKVDADAKTLQVSNDGVSYSATADISAVPQPWRMAIVQFVAGSVWTGDFSGV